MAKVSFNKLNGVKSLPPVKHLLGECELEIEQYLPLEKKIDLITSVIEQSGNGEEGFFNIVKLEAYYQIEVIKAYTNINFTDKQLEDIPKLYDLIQLNHIWESVESVIPKNELEYIWNNILSLAKEITNYNSSALGILKAISNDRDGLNLDLTELVDQINDPQSFNMVKDLVEKMG